MDIKDRFSEESLQTIKEYLQENNNKSMIFKATFDDNELIQEPFFLSLYKKKNFEETLTKVGKNEVVIRTTKPNQLYPSDMELELSEELYNRRNIAYSLLSSDLDDFYFVQDIDRIFLEKINIENYFSKDGILAKEIKGFEYRQEQEEMAHYIQDAINEDRKIIIEAGTGTGKTLAYLIPAIKWAVVNKKKVIIATNTINLQEQLLLKDIPLAKSIIKEDFSYVLVKGRSNYLCKRLFNELSIGRSIDIEIFSMEAREQIECILKWGNKTKTGDKAELPFEVYPDVWELIQSTTELCLGKKCPYRKECFYMKTRMEKMEADILISNHHVFFADLNVRAETDFDSEYLILPRYDMVIFDEAHNIESVARSYFSVEVSKISFTRLLNRIYQKKNKRKKEKSALIRVEDTIDEKDLEDSQQYVYFLNTLKEEISILQNIGDEYFDEIRKIYETNTEAPIRKSLNNFEMTKSRFLETLRDKKDIFQSKLADFLTLMISFNNVIDEEKEKNPEVINFNNHLKMFKAYIDSFKFINSFEDDNYIYWLDINSKRTNVLLTATPLNIAEKLSTVLFDNLDRLVFASATIVANGSFDYFKKSLGLDEEDCIECIIKSPFNYDEQMSVYIPTDIQDSENINAFVTDASKFILNILLKTGGKAFILFTSYTMLNQIYYSISKKLMNKGFEVFLHGDKPRSQLIKEFKEAENPILFGTTSFWEGVDVQGENLSNVIITKLPFLVPTDPVVSAISKKIEEDGGNSFTDFQLPEAIIKFKQGVGRLIRKKTDSGNIFILDNRILKKRYGSLFINALPSQKNIKILEKDDIIEEIE
ncbi:ATP-dependent DNA helicase [Fusobacterium nucleatum]|uniref:ATP-dependent DNA helicase n=1 Tax=Fusobacterium nucleatum TaxID=851 RepID=UPI00040E741C|nr:ATP-dependent DNA helicase [Fusobacterium nucleatum]ALF24156.1 ATP-dependent helicase [Fusobacterium nucleatum subsp. nucleatum ChDC F316]ALF25211.1 ATP-dependent helicase [Fusobacterium nucleatum subsp. nucleatum]